MDTDDERKKRKREKVAAYKAAHPEKVRETNRRAVAKWQQKNRPAYLARLRAWREKQREKGK